MFNYYLELALRSFRRNRVLTALMVLAIALGIGASMTTLTVFYVLSGDPIPHKSRQLFNVQLDPRPLAGFQPGAEPSDQLTRFDAETLLREAKAPRQAMMTGGSGAIQPNTTTLRPFIAQFRYTTADFFSMFDAPFGFGQGWSADDDGARARVAVISKSLNDRLFAGANSVGETLRIDGNALRVVGVLEDWTISPRFYDLSTSRYGNREEVFIPFATAIDLKLTHQGSVSCHGREVANDTTALNAPCTWIQYWVELPAAAQVADYRSYLDNYSSQQRAAGRYERPPNTRLRDVMSWLDHKNIVPGDVRLQLWLAFGFLVVCLVNTVGLLLAKFLRRSGEIGVRRALGASRRAIFTQYLVEAGAIGLAGGLLGLGVSYLGLWMVRQQPVGYAGLAYLNLEMLLLTFVLAVLASVLAGLLPAWRASRVAPAIQLKSQ